MNQHKHFSILSFAVIAGLILSAIQVTAQESSQPLKLDDAIRMAKEQNRQIGISKTDEKLSLSRYKQTEAIWLPQVNLSYTGFTTNQPLNAFGFKLQQAQVTAADFDPAKLNHPGATSNVMTQLSVQQPLFNPDLVYLRKAALKESEATQFKTQRTEEAIAMQVTQAYLQLDLSYEMVKVIEKSLETVKEIYRFTNDRYQQGMLQKSDLLQVDVQVKTTETQLAEARSQVKNISDQLNLLMNTGTHTVYTTVPNELTTGVYADSVSAARADIKAMQTAISAYDLAIQSTQKSMLPKLNAFANYQLNDPKVFGFGANAYLAGIQLSWDIFKGNQSKNKIATQRLEKTKLQQQIQEQLEQGNTEIRKTKRQLDDSRYRISQQQLATEQAAEALRIIRNRYSQGLVNTTDVLMAQTQEAQQQLLLAQAKFIQQSTLSYLQFLTTTK